MVGNHKRIEHLWRKEGLKVPAKQPKRGRLWLNDGSWVWLCPATKNHVWSYDVAHRRTNDDRTFCLLNILDEFIRECLAIKVARRLCSRDVLEVLGERGIPAHLRSDNGSEFVAGELRQWL